jgi:hypothetical protein
MYWSKVYCHLLGMPTLISIISTSLNCHYRDIVIFHFTLYYYCEECYCSFLSQSRRKLGVMVESWILISDAIFSLLRCFVFVAAYLENQISHRYDVGKGISLSTADLDCFEYPWRRLHLNSVSAAWLNFCFNVKLKVMSIKLSSSWTDAVWFFRNQERIFDPWHIVCCRWDVVHKRAPQTIQILDYVIENCFLQHIFRVYQKVAQSRKPFKVLAF